MTSAESCESIPMMAGIVPSGTSRSRRALPAQRTESSFARRSRASKRTTAKTWSPSVDLLELTDETAPDVGVRVRRGWVEDHGIARQRTGAEDVLGKHPEHGRDGERPFPIGIGAVGRLVDAKDDAAVAIEAGRDVRQDGNAAGRERGRAAVGCRGRDRVRRLGKAQPIELLRWQLAVEAGGVRAASAASEADRDVQRLLVVCAPRNDMSANHARSDPRAC